MRMRKVSGVLAFVGLLLIAGVTEAPAIAFNSVAGTAATCTGVQAGCDGGVLQAIAPVPGIFQPNNPGGSTAVWVSHRPDTGQGGGFTVIPNAPTVNQGDATETFSIAIGAGYASLTLSVWADDTGGVRLDDGAAYIASTNGKTAPNPIQATNCSSAAGLTCLVNGQADYFILLGGAAHTIQFDIFQRGAGTFGFMYAGELAVPEPATLLLVGSTLAAVGFVSRRRLQKAQQNQQA